MDAGASGYALGANDGERLAFGGGTVLIKAASALFTIWEELPPLLDTPLHVHEHEDELFHILEGDHVFLCGGDEFNVGPGGFLALPRGVPRAHRRVVPTAGRFLVMTCPGGFAASSGCSPTPIVWARSDRRPTPRHPRSTASPGSPERRVPPLP